ncbi:MAG: cation transporter [Ignavibacterium album]|jgi:divalent metal cation (Fe/Co/Zn/Cd) transporter|uniref:cation transporter n=1 Tax=Ignavibacterium album TaxID=591197 RepID=UPI0026EBD72A|nr:cation transporter [Ignavibacterium album]MCX8106880.1 cation transporter [Ignavibacterium album]
MKNLLIKALILSLITIFYNLVEGIISVYYGADDETLALFGFGVDSFVEVISGIGIAHMIFRMKYSKVQTQDTFEKTALKITGTAFYLLTAGLIIGSVLNLINNVKPETTIPGIIIALISILTMYWLMTSKLKIGKAMQSDAVIADANCTKTCFYLSFILLASSGLYELFNLMYFDIIGSLGIAYFAFNEGKEAFEKVKSGNLMCNC